MYVFNFCSGQCAGWSRIAAVIRGVELLNLQKKVFINQTCIHDLHLFVVQSSVGEQQCDD